MSANGNLIRRTLVLGFSAMLIFIGGYAAGQAQRSKDVMTVSTVDAVSEVDPVLEFRTEREQLRARQRSELNDIIYNSAADAETVRLAQRQLMDLMTCEAQETNLEGVLRARGFSDALVTVQGDSVNVLVRGEALNQSQSAMILDAVLRETGVTGGNVKIIPIN